MASTWWAHGGWTENRWQDRSQAWRSTEQKKSHMLDLKEKKKVDFGTYRTLERAWRVGEEMVESLARGDTVRPGSSVVG